MLQKIYFLIIPFNLINLPAMPPRGKPAGSVWFYSVRNDFTGFAMAAFIAW